mmetsp:Transcript_10645/g.37007  ORF Transcript_10645/g.37007 Transcript_10645/m.37007 type:complete len:260 (-) Transcript_10645:667-1446(-)
MSESRTPRGTGRASSAAGASSAASSCEPRLPSCESRLSLLPRTAEAECAAFSAHAGPSSSSHSSIARWSAACVCAFPAALRSASSSSRDLRGSDARPKAGLAGLGTGAAAAGLEAEADTGAGGGRAALRASPRSADAETGGLPSSIDDAGDAMRGGRSVTLALGPSPADTAPPKESASRLSAKGARGGLPALGGGAAAATLSSSSGSPDATPAVSHWKMARSLLPAERSHLSSLLKRTLYTWLECPMYSRHGASSTTHG